MTESAAPKPTTEDVAADPRQPRPSQAKADPAALDRIADLQASLNDASVPSQATPEFPADYAPFHDLTWWEKRERASSVAKVRREAVRAAKLRNRSERFQQRQNEVLSWFGKTNQLRGLDIQAGGAVDVVNAGAIENGWLKTKDGRRVKKAPNQTLYLQRPLKAGPITIWLPNNPEPITEQSPRGLTDEMLLALPGGGLRNALQAGNRDGLKLGAAGKWGLVILIVIGFVAALVWLWSRGVFG
jgi:hypothetical protein